jgi:hypothetical protein
MQWLNFLFISLWLFDEYRNKTYGAASLKMKLFKSSASLVFVTKKITKVRLIMFWTLKIEKPWPVVK